ncbi:RNA polymerase sigma factor [Dysgonomonas sp. GY75]|uniref:RNA polymerase sigma factor n=1 Tax=Dysgonomonas sp. GY75 TaxID=2780419 RepID=UPI0018843020|nr:RNA polymerase sigma factor [Dysgonomonas sp. GY75]MBF0647924.1 RNA polymerase sigma factor [Dysgonomonas sp. GY75]
MNQDTLDQKTKEDNTSYADFYKKYVNELYSYAISLGFTENNCMDSIHDIFVSIFFNGVKFHDTDNIKYYLFRSLKNKLINIRKQEQRLTFDNMDHCDFAINISAIDTIMNEEEQLQTENTVRRLMESLTNNQREAIYLRYMQNMEYNEIALLLDINVESVRKLVYRGMCELRKSRLDIFFILLIYLKEYNFISLE